MKEYSMKEQFALIALDAQNSEHYTAAKKAAVRGIVMAGYLQKVLDGADKEDISEISAYLAKKTKEVRNMNKKEWKMAEQETVRDLTKVHALSKVPDLLGCDMNYRTAGVGIWQYKCDEEDYLRITESVRAEILEPGEVSAETVCLLYLFRECGCMHDIFSVKEQEAVEKRLIGIMAEEAFYKAILQTEFHSWINNAYVSFVKKKHKLFQNPYLQGVNLAFPFFDRRQAIFIDMIILGTSVTERRERVIQFLRENGHCCEDISMGGEHLLKIDNSYYKVWPSTRSCRIPVQGVELLPVYR